MKDFIALLGQASALAVNRALTQAEQQALSMGNVLAEQFIEAARADELPPDALMYAVALAGKAGDNGDSVLRGFLQRITAEVAQP